jgi:hypothetical protein
MNRKSHPSIGTALLRARLDRVAAIEGLFHRLSRLWLVGRA